jgi:hypothetical protein
MRGLAWQHLVTTLQIALHHAEPVTAWPGLPFSKHAGMRTSWLARWPGPAAGPAAATHLKQYRSGVASPSASLKYHVMTKLTRLLLKAAARFTASMHWLVPPLAGSPLMPMRSSRKKMDTVGLISTARFFTRGLLLGCNWPLTVLPPLGGTPTGGGGLLRAGDGGERGGGFWAVAKANTQHRAVSSTAACRVVRLQPMRVTVHVGMG